VSDVLKYGATAKWLHWLIAVPIILMLILAPGMEDQTIEQRQETVMGHAGLGTLILLFMLIRWPWRLTHKPPGPTAKMSPWQVRFAQWMHHALYILIPLQAIFGILQAMYITDYEVVAFGVVNYSTWLADDAVMAKVFHVCHSINSKLLMLLVLIHVGAALYHHFVQRDEVLKRMLPFGKIE